VTGLVSESLKIKNKLGGLFGRCFVSVKAHRYEIRRAIRKINHGISGDGTFEVLSFEQYGAYVVLLDQDLDLICDRGAIEAHHEQLAELPVIYRSVSALHEAPKADGRAIPRFIPHGGHIPVGGHGLDAIRLLGPHIQGDWLAARQVGMESVEEFGTEDGNAGGWTHGAHAHGAPVGNRGRRLKVRSGGPAWRQMSNERRNRKRASVSTRRCCISRWQRRVG
jgi:hypothetical protein